MRHLTVEERLERAPAPEAAAARERARRVVTAAPVAGRSRRRLRPLLLAGALAVALVPSADAIANWLADLVDPDPTAAPAPEPHLDALPSPGRVLVTGPGGAWWIARDGTRERLGDYDALAWSPRGLFVVAAQNEVLRALTPDGAEHWAVTAPAEIADPVWSPSGFRIAYRAGDELRVVAGDGTGDRALTTDVAPAVPAWRPGQGHALALARPDGAVEVWDVDAGVRTRRIAGGAPVVALMWTARGRLLVVRRDAVGSGPVTAATLVGSRLVVAVGARVSTLGHSGRGRPRLRLTAAGPVSDLIAAPTGSRILVASSSADQWVFLPLGRGGAPTAATVRGFTDVAGWETEPLAVAAMGDGRTIALSPIRGGSECLAVTGLDRFDRQCMYAPSRRSPVATAALMPGPVAQRSATAPIEVYGELSDAVDRVEIRYTLGGAPATQEAIMLRARDLAALARARISQPFGAFVAELPSTARTPIAVAYDASGRELARDGFAAVHPHAFIGTAGPGDLPDYSATPWAQIEPVVSAGARFDDVSVTITAPQRSGRRRHYTAYANGIMPAAGCVNARDGRFPSADAGAAVSTTLSLSAGEGGPEGWCPGRYRGTIEYSGPGFRSRIARFAFTVRS